MSIASGESLTQRPRAQSRPPRDEPRVRLRRGNRGAPGKHRRIQRRERRRAELLRRRPDRAERGPLRRHVSGVPGRQIPADRRHLATEDGPSPGHPCGRAQSASSFQPLHRQPLGNPERLSGRHVFEPRRCGRRGDVRVQGRQMVHAGQSLPRPLPSHARVVERSGLAGFDQARDRPMGR